MKPFDYARPQSRQEAFALLSRPGARALAGGTNLVDLMRAEVMTPALCVDVSGLGWDAIIDTPDFELVGLYVYSADKAGQDAGDLVDRGKTDVLATNDMDAVLALGADCVVFNGLGDTKDPMESEETICRILASGLKGPPITPRDSAGSAARAAPSASSAPRFRAPHTPIARRAPGRSVPSERAHRSRCRPPTAMPWARRG